MVFFEDYGLENEGLNTPDYGLDVSSLFPNEKSHDPHTLALMSLVTSLVVDNYKRKSRYEAIENIKHNEINILFIEKIKKLSYDKDGIKYDNVLINSPGEVGNLIYRLLNDSILEIEDEKQQLAKELFYPNGEEKMKLKFPTNAWSKRNKDLIIKEDGICPITKKHCDDECCPVGATCNMGNDNLISPDEPTQDIV